MKGRGKIGAAALAAAFALGSVWPSMAAADQTVTAASRSDFIRVLQAAASDQPSASAEATASDRKAAPRRIAFASLDADLGPRDVLRRTTWTVPLPAKDLPAGTRLTGAHIDVSVAPDGTGRAPVISVTMNGLLLGSAVARRDGPTHLPLNIPESAQAVENDLAVTVTRQGGDTTGAPGPRAQVLPSSFFRLGKAGKVTDFYQLAPLYRNGVTISLADTSPAVLAGTAGILRGLVAGSTPLNVQVGHVPQTGPVVWASRMPPLGSDPAIRFDRGRVRLATTFGVPLVGNRALRSRTVVQLLRVGDRPVLWIRPGEGFGAPGSAPASDLLSRGDVAVVDGERLELAFNSGQDSIVEIAYPDRIGLLGLLARYRLWLIGAGWLILSLGFLHLLRGITQARMARS